ncbi:hypothetical protein BDN72DRAFT_392173 [Pluteus cervinus]|uniref:Uncharacterized protein n=1 Tax=Pluteus cervinus TaxID=181527 RepID=A0ACD3AC19_9AGAR|nr:hypothetical protein BDN72DRAFT_392173 [Pluteus cervinus]
MFVAVATLLSNLSNPGQLQEVYIAVLVSIPVPSRMDHIQTNWKAISHRLSSPAFHKLRTVCIGLRTSYENMDQIIEQLKGLLQSMFRGLDERGILKFIDSEYPSLISHHDCWYL